MIGAATEIGSPHELPRINHQLAAALHREPAELATGAEAASEDDLIICGLLGGKDVGKSTLINALAKTEVSLDTVEVGKGTERPMAYVHEAVRENVIHRLNAIDRHVTVDVTPHRADAIRNVVLVDLPDFDSEFLNHLDIVRAVAPLMDRILWVVTPRKIGDRAWVRMLRDVCKDPSNVHCVLNKVDELVADCEPSAKTGGDADGDGRRAQTIWEEQHRWVADSLATVNCPYGDDHRFLVAAAFADPDRFVSRVGELWDDPDWTEYTHDLSTVAQVARLAGAELDRLRSCVLSPVAAAEGRTMKAANRDREQRVNIARMKQHYDLDRAVERIAQACDPTYHQQMLNEAMGPDYCSSVAAALGTQLRSDTELADELLAQRVEHWPLLRLVHWPFGWLSRALGRRVSPASRATPVASVDPFDISGHSLVDRIGLLRSRILADHAVATRQLDVETELPAAAELATRVTAGAQRLPAQLESRLLAGIRERDRSRRTWGSLLAKVGLWLILLWFPLVQPILSGLLEMFSETGTWQLAHGLYRIVSALSAAHLLGGLAVVTGIYVAILAGMYARALRTIRLFRAEQDECSPIAEAVDELLISEAVAPLVLPFQDRLERLTALRSRLEHCDCRGERNA